MKLLRFPFFPWRGIQIYGCPRLGVGLAGLVIRYMSTIVNKRKICKIRRGKGLHTTTLCTPDVGSKLEAKKWLRNVPSNTGFKEKC